MSVSASSAMPAAVLAAAAAIYLLVPGADGAPLSAGLPLGPLGAVAFSLSLLLAFAGRSIGVARSTSLIGLAVLLVAAGAKVSTNATGEVGWSGNYYANESWSGAPEWSSEFRTTDRTRIDRAIDFENNTLPTHFLNSYQFDRGNRREVELALSAEWRGYFHSSAGNVTLTASHRGSLSVAVDGVAVEPREAGARVVTVGDGVHEVLVRYAKPAGVDASVHVSITDASGPVVVTTTQQPWSNWVTPVSTAADLVVIALLAWLSLVILRHYLMDPARRVDAAVLATAVVLFAAQGWWEASRFAGRFVSLTENDDWWGFESRAREILQHGPLMLLGQSIGDGAAYFFHPFYSYFLAAVHVVMGESLFGPVFVQFLILAAVTVILWRLTKECFGVEPALISTLALVTLFEVDFTRYYTVTLLSENLYILTVSLSIASLARWARDHRNQDLLIGGLWAGVSSITRPGMLIALLPMLVVIAIVATRRSSSGWRPAAIALAAWMAPVSLTAIRNWVVASRLVLVSDGLGGGVLKYNIPESVDPAPYLAAYTGGIFSSAIILARIAFEHPWQFAATQIEKFGFTLGMTHWHEGYRPHPELVMFSALYIAMFFFSRTLRQPAFWPAHVFVVCHVLSMALTSPWNYGYRLILPAYVLMAPLSVGAACALALGKRGVGLQLAGASR